MKILLLLFLLGCATAVPVYKALEDKADFALLEQLLEEEEDEIKTELVKKLRDRLKDIAETIKEHMKKGQEIKDSLIEEFKEHARKLKDMGSDFGDHLKEALKDLKEKGKGFLEKLKDKVKNKFKDFLDKISDFLGEKSAEKQFVDFNIKDIFQKIRALLLGNVDKEKLKEKIEEFFGKGSQMAKTMLQFIHDKGDHYKQKLLDLIDRFLGRNEEKRSISELFEKIKDFFKNLGIDLKEKFVKLGEFIKEHWNKGFDATKDKIQNLKAIINELIDHAKELSKETAREALELIEMYKDDLGVVYEKAKQIFEDIIRKKD